MATSLLIRNLGADTKKRLRLRAAEKGHSMEQEAREILDRALATEEPEHFVDRIRRRVEKYGGIDIPEIPRHRMRDPIKF
jgi:plasmid stability protein